MQEELEKAQKYHDSYESTDESSEEEDETEDKDDTEEMDDADKDDNEYIDEISSFGRIYRAASSMHVCSVAARKFLKPVKWQFSLSLDSCRSKLPAKVAAVFHGKLVVQLQRN